MTTDSPLISIEVVYAEADQQQLISLSVNAGTSARQVLRYVLKQNLIVLNAADETRFDMDTLPIGVYGQIVADDYRLREGERLELYRPLLQDPMERRRKVASKMADKTAR